MLKINDLSYSVENSFLLKEISLQIENSKIVSLLAPFGSGKSTLFKLICSSNTNDKIKNDSKIFYMPSVPIIINDYSVTQNIKFYNNSINDEEIKVLLEKVGLSGYGSHIPQMINSGFIFRLTFAIGLSLGSKLFLLDDSLNNMKNKSKIEIIDFLRFFVANNDISIFLGTSNFMDAIYLSDKIYFAKAQPMEIVAEKEVVNSKFTVKEKLVSNDFNNYRTEIEQEIKKHNLSNFII